jgi:hypothetical protein
MQFFKSFCLGLIIICSAFTLQAQGTFQNLGFESANLTPIPSGLYGGPVSTLDAIPGWKAFLGTTQVTQVLQNNITLGDASIDILGPFSSIGRIIEGQYTVVLQPGGVPFGSGENIGASISQTGLVPANAHSLQFKAITYGSISVSLSGHELVLIPLETGSRYTLYGADISTLAGQVQTLTITALAGPNATYHFDSFVFSPSAVPEPSTIGMLALGGLLVGLRRRFNCATVRRGARIGKSQTP